MLSTLTSPATETTTAEAIAALKAFRDLAQGALTTAVWGVRKRRPTMNERYVVGRFSRSNINRRSRTFDQPENLEMTENLLRGTTGIVREEILPKSHYSPRQPVFFHPL